MVNFYLTLILFALTFNVLLGQSSGLTLEGLNRNVNQIATSKVEKVRAIYSIIAKNINYDVKNIPKLTDRDTLKPSEKIEYALRTRKGTCGHYSLLFDTLCKMNKIRSFVVIGYTKHRKKKIGDLSHAWNIVELNNEYFPVDVTWGAGFVFRDRFYKRYNEKFLFTKPKSFAKTHMPFDPIWQLSASPINNLQFEQGKMSGFSKAGMFHFKDSILDFKELNKRSQMKAKKRRLEEFGLTNHLILREYKYYEDWIICEGYDTVLALFTEGVCEFDEYLSWKNQYFKNPEKTDKEIKEKFDEAQLKIEQGHESISSMITINDKMKRAKEILLLMQAPLMIQLERESWFVDEYLNLAKQNISRLFLWNKIY